MLNTSVSLLLLGSVFLQMRGVSVEPLVIHVGQGMGGGVEQRVLINPPGSFKNG